MSGGTIRAVVVFGFSLATALPAVALAQPPPPVTLLAGGNKDVATQRFMKLVGSELARRAQPLVDESEAASLLGRPLSAAVQDCSGDDLCYLALGQVVHATQVIVGSVSISTKDATKYECVFRVIESKSGKTRGPLMVTVIASENGLGTAANTVAENVAPRPRIAAVATATPVVVLPTPPPIATPAATPVPSATSIAVGIAEPTPTPGTAGMDVTPIPFKPPRKGRTKDPAFWSIAGAGLLVVGVGMFFGAKSLQQEPEEKEGESTVGVHF